MKKAIDNAFASFMALALVLVIMTIAGIPFLDAASLVVVLFVSVILQELRN